MMRLRNTGVEETVELFTHLPFQASPVIAQPRVGPLVGAFTSVRLKENQGAGKSNSVFFSVVKGVTVAVQIQAKLVSNDKLDFISRQR
jgi:hypothetical protein